MLNEAARKWIEALRSDKYKQAIGSLKTEDGYCCLGVACELAKKEGVIDDFLGKSKTLAPYTEVINWLNLRTSEGAYHQGPSRVRHFLTEDNDSGLSFEEIADIIESDPEGMFRE